MLSLKLDSKSESLKADFRTWLKSNRPPVLSETHELSEFVDVSRRWQSQLAAERWVGVHWPEQYGGRGLTILHESLMQECLAEFNSPQLVNLFGLTMVGPVLIKHGTDAQRERYLNKILSAEEIWCQGFSEPEAGSDLAAVKSKAEKVAGGTGYALSGQKVWTSFAQYANWCFVLALSNPEAPRYQNLSYFLVPMTAEGITTRPLKQISGDSEFNEVFFDSVKIGEDLRVGAEGEGWKIAISTLMYERVVLTFSRHLQSETLLNRIGELLKIAGKNAMERELYEFGRLKAKSMAVRALALKHLYSYATENLSPGPEGSLDKLGWSESFQEITSFGLKLADKYGSKAVQELFLHQYLYSRGRTIAAGTSEIQRNIIADRVLGLRV
jgi:alkylation response protein AidB-like acyl-CoA dehydrogenase